MIFSTLNKIPVFLLDKLDVLLHLLQERKQEFETFAANLDNKQLKRTVLSLAQETNQYAVELASQIEMMGGHIRNFADFDTSILSNMPKPLEGVSMITGESDILKSCELSETKMILAYRSILNEPFLHENLRKLFRCQLNGITYAFMQLRLLNNSYSQHI